jgi:hypothetical protein
LPQINAVTNCDPIPGPAPRKTPIIRTRWPMLAGGAGPQIIYSAVADRQSVQHAGAVSPRFLLSVGYEHHDVRLRGLYGSGTSP